MLVTALQLIEAGLSKIGMLAAGETVSAEDAAIGLQRLNSLIDAMENEGMFGYTTTDTVVTLPASTVSLTIGAAQQINIVRPIKIMQGSFSRLSDTDYPLHPVNEEEYNKISLKSTVESVAPVVCFYDGGNPTGNVYFWPTVEADVELHLITPEAGGEATDLTTAYAFPPGYIRYIENALGIEMAPDFNTTPSPFILSAAANAKRAIKRTNNKIPQMDLAYPHPGRYNSISNIISGEYP